MAILHGYGMGPRVTILLEAYWYHQCIVPEAEEWCGCKLIVA